MNKPQKPNAEFPLFPASNGQWAKKIRGKRHYFGVWSDPQAALSRYLDVKDFLHAGRTPRPTGGTELWVLCNLFLDAKKTAAESGEIKFETYLEYKRTCGTVLKILGRSQDATSLTAQDFTDLRRGLAKTYSSAVTLRNELTRCRVLFAWAFDSGTIPSPLAYKVALAKPKARLLRKARNDRPKQLFSPSEINALLNAASGYLKPCIYLAINCGLGNRDCCELRWDNIHNGWLDFPRPKSHIVRRAKLWESTQAALASWRNESPVSQHVVCGINGKPLGAAGAATPISHLFSDLAKECKVATSGRGFYAIRHTYRTVADRTKDSVAIGYTMGHADHSIAGQYIEQIEDERLETIAEAVRAWLG